MRLNPTEQSKIHRRRIDTVVYESTTDAIVVEGTLQDERFRDTHHPIDAVRPPYIVHHMIIRLVLQLPERVIRDIEVEMPVAPHGACHEAKQCLAPLIGMRIAPGFTARVRKSVGRKAGCNHLQALLAAMAPAAFQGAWSFRVSRPIDPESYRGMAQNLRDSCWAWREGGPLVKKLIDIE